MATSEPCVFCAIVNGDAPATIVQRTNMVIVIEPLNPVTPGHLLVIPTTHVEDFTSKPAASAFTMHAAAQVAAAIGPCNLITSKGREATQTIRHLHLHVVPRREGDGLALPWTKGAPDGE